MRILTSANESKFVRVLHLLDLAVLVKVEAPFRVLVVSLDVTMERNVTVNSIKRMEKLVSNLS